MAVAIGLAAAASAGPADVIDVEVRPAGASRWSFRVTVRHDDAGWDHYADRWEILAPDGSVLATRVLRHPHVDEQPFTRGLVAELPAGIDHVRVRAHDSSHGYGGAELRVALPPQENP